MSTGPNKRSSNAQRVFEGNVGGDSAHSETVAYQALEHIGAKLVACEKEVNTGPGPKYDFIIKDDEETKGENIGVEVVRAMPNKSVKWEETITKKLGKIRKAQMGCTTYRVAWSLLCIVCLESDTKHVVRLTRKLTNGKLNANTKVLVIGLVGDGANGVMSNETPQ